MPASSAMQTKRQLVPQQKKNQQQPQSQQSTNEKTNKIYINSPLVSNVVKKQKNTNNDNEERKNNRKFTFDEKRRRHAMLLSPGAQQSPKATISTKIKSPSSYITVTANPNGGLKKFGSLLQSPKPQSILQNIPIEQMTKTFEEWMRIAADNKINAKNSWSLALIDYFSELTVLKEGDSINFQKASCTLDGCVKIYTSRVDSVADETGKLLHGLNNGQNDWTDVLHDERVLFGSKDNPEDAEGGDLQDEETKANSFTTPSNASAHKKPKGSHKQAVTLEKNIESLNLKIKDDFDAVTTDPLFRKACTDFNGGSSRSFLLNSLCIDEGGLIVFDSFGMKSPFSSLLPTAAPQDASFDMTALRKKFAGEIADIPNKSTCPSIASTILSFNDRAQDENAGPLTSTAEMQKLLKRLAEVNIRVETYFNKEREEEMTQGQGHFGGDALESRDPVIFNRLDDQERDFNVDYLAQGFDHENSSINSSNSEFEEGEGGGVDRDGDGDGDGGEKPTDEKPQSKKISTAATLSDSMMEMQLVDGGDVETNNSLSIFDHINAGKNNSRFKSGWAGPQHWKIQRQLSSISSAFHNRKNNLSLFPTSGISGSKTNREGGKKNFSIEFSTADTVNIDELFAKTGNLSTITNSMSSMKEKATRRFLLPEDYKFSSRDLQSLFTKPKFNISKSIKIISLGSKTHISNGESAHAEKTPNCSEAHLIYDEKECVERGGEVWQISGNLEDGVGSEIIKLQQESDGGFGGDEDGGNNDDRIFLGSQSNPQKAAFKGTYNHNEDIYGSLDTTGNPIGYSKTAKRVDVKRLKDNVWKELQFLLTEKCKSKTEETVVIKFDDVCNGLIKCYGGDTEGQMGGGVENEDMKGLRDISPQYSFICLLHLANEREFSLRNGHNREVLIEMK